MIEKFLMEGKQNAIKAQKLADLVGCKSIRDAEYIQTLRSRAKNTLVAIEPAETYLKQLEDDA